jgi:hypothetical protein
MFHSGRIPNFSCVCGGVRRPWVLCSRVRRSWVGTNRHRPVARCQVSLMRSVIYDESVWGWTHDPLEWFPSDTLGPLLGSPCPTRARCRGTRQGWVLSGLTYPIFSSWPTSSNDQRPFLGAHSHWRALETRDHIPGKRRLRFEFFWSKLLDIYVYYYNQFKGYRSHTMAPILNLLLIQIRRGIMAIILKVHIFIHMYIRITRIEIFFWFFIHFSHCSWVTYLFLVSDNYCLFIVNKIRIMPWSSYFVSCMKYLKLYHRTMANTYIHTCRIKSNFLKN